MSSSSELTENDINNLGDLLQAFQLMQSLEVDYRGVSSLEDAKCRLLQYIRDKFGAGRHRHSNVSRKVCFESFKCDLAQQMWFVSLTPQKIETVLKISNVNQQKLHYFVLKYIPQHS